MATRLQLPVDDSVVLHITHSNLKSFSADVRFSLETTIESVKEKLWKKTGTSVDSMSLQLYDDSGIKVSDLTDNLKPLGFYSPHSGYRVHIVDLDPSSVTSGGWLEDTSLVEKYSISEEAFDKLDGTFRKFKEKLASRNPSLVESKIPDNNKEDLCAKIKVGDRCEVDPGEKRGVVKYIGEAETIAPGFWVGVQYDEPLGKHDGMVKGKRYFECPPLHGAMVRPDKVKLLGMSEIHLACDCEVKTPGPRCEVEVHIQHLANWDSLQGLKCQSRPRNGKKADAGKKEGVWMKMKELFNFMDAQKDTQMKKAGHAWKKYKDKLRQY